jgi:glycosyltransferase 2 family protein
MKYLKPILLGLIAIGLYFFLRSTDWAAIGHLIQSIGWKALWLLFFTLLSAIFGAIGWQYCIGASAGKVHFLDLFFIRHIGEVVGLLNPTGIVGGDAVKANMLTKKGIDTQTAVTSIFVSRALTMLSHFAVFFVAACFVNTDLSLRIAMVFVVVVAVIWIIYRLWSAVVQRLVSRLRAWLVARRYTKMVHGLRTVLAQLKLLAQFDKRAMCIAFLFLSLHWVMGGSEFWVILRLLGHQVDLADAVLIDTGVGFFKAAGIIVPGQLGVEEYGNKYMLESVGVHDPQIWVTASILRRARQLFWIVFGLVVYLTRYRKQAAG